jgi:hypothetical protein
MLSLYQEGALAHGVSWEAPAELPAVGAEDVLGHPLIRITEQDV